MVTLTEIEKSLKKLSNRVKDLQHPFYLHGAGGENKYKGNF